MIVKLPGGSIFKMTMIGFSIAVFAVLLAVVPLALLMPSVTIDNARHPLLLIQSGSLRGQTASPCDSVSQFNAGIPLRFDPIRTDSLAVAGRFRFATDSGSLALEFDWSCVTVRGEFNGGFLSIVMNGGHSFFSVSTSHSNASSSTILETDNSMRAYSIFSNPGGSSEVATQFEVIKITEAEFALLPLKKVQILGFCIEDSSPPVHAPADLPSNRPMIEYLGDSDTDGFGINASHHQDPVCLFKESSENCNVGFAAQLANLVNADYSMVAYSGKGVIKNSISLFPVSKYPMPYYFKLALASEPSTMWDSKVSGPFPYRQRVPDVVVVYLGSNDYLTIPYPSEDAFVTGYVRMIDMLNDMYLPSTKFLHLCGALGLEGLGVDLGSKPDFCLFIEKTINNTLPSSSLHNSNAVQSSFPSHYYTYIPPSLVSADEDRGCVGHVSLLGQTKIAAFLKPYLQQLI